MSELEKTVQRPPNFIFRTACASVFVLGVSRCSTISERSEFGLRAPSSVSLNDSSSRDWRNVKDPATRAVLAYRASTLSQKANLNLEACEGFRNLALDQKVRLPEAIRLLAQVRTLQVCPDERILPPNQVPKWLAEEYARANLVVARRKGEPKALAVALRDVAPFEKTQKLKVEKFQEALALLERAAKDSAGNREIETERLTTTARLIAVAPRFALTLEKAEAARPPEPMQIASDLRNSRDFDKARSIYESIVADQKRTDLERLKALDGIRMSYKLQLRTPEFIAASKKWQEFAKKQFLAPGLKRRDASLLKVYLDTRIQYARAVWTDHRSDDAKKILLDTEKLVHGKVSVHEAMLIRARIAEETGNFNETASIMYQIPIDSLPDRASKARFLWYKGWNLRRLLTPASRLEAIAALEQAATFEDRQSDLTRDQYWTARLYKDLGETEKARKLFTDLADASQFGFYGIIAQRELGLPFQSLKHAVDLEYNPAQSSPVVDAVRIPVDWFILLGEFEVGRRYVDSFAPEEIWNSNFSLDKKEATLVMLSRLEQHALVNQRIDELPVEDRKRLLLKRPELMFPLPYQERILAETTKQNVPPALVYSIMRQESLFNPFARSPADAFGLMQLIPEMAHVAAKSLGVEFHGPEDLYDPDKNIALGTVFLRNLFRRYNNQFILAVSAYNANDRAIQGWVKTRMRSDPLEFIEEIPYDETRLYVKLVMRNFVTYQRRMSSTPVEFPESLLKLPTSVSP